MKSFPLFSLFVLVAAISCKQDSNQIVKSGDTSSTVSTLAGSTSGYADGLGTLAKFAAPHGIAVDAGGNLYVADNQNQRIRKISPSGTVTTLAGSTVGNTNGTGVNAQFNYPEGIAVDATGSIFVVDSENHSIRKITSAGVVSTLAGSASGFADGQGAAANFNFPTGIAVDASGNVFVADTENYKIRKITSTGVVTTLAGSTQGFADGASTNAQFNSPTGIAIDANGNLYVTDTYKIRKITSAGVVSTLAGSSTAGYADGKGTEARFTNPYGIAIDSNNTLYVADSDNDRIRKITADGTVTTIAGGTQGYADGSGTIAQFNYPKGIAVASGIIYVADEANNKIRKIIP
jgi:sugar lactone lactonase YvrE